MHIVLDVSGEHNGIMTAELADDLKQFIDQRLVPSGVHFNSYNQRFSDLGLKLDTAIDTLGTLFVKHHSRLSRLESVD